MARLDGFPNFLDKFVINSDIGEMTTSRAGQGADGHSALFLLLRDTAPERLTAVLRQSNGKILQTSLSKEEDAKLRAAFGADEVEA